MDSMESIKQTFFLECDEQLSELEVGLLAMEEGRAEPDTVNAVFRAVHSIKGGAGAFKLTDLVQFSHAFETVLDQVRSDKLDAVPPVVRILLRAADVLSDLVAAARDNRQVGSSGWEAVRGELDSLSANPDQKVGVQTGTEPPPGGASFGFTPSPIAFDFAELPVSRLPSGPITICFKPLPDLYAKANEVVPILRELSRVGNAVAHCDTSAVPFLEDFDVAGAYLSWTILLETIQGEGAIREPFEFVDGDCLLEISGIASEPEMLAVEAMPELQPTFAEVSANLPPSAEVDLSTLNSQPAESLVAEPQPPIAAGLSKNETNVLQSTQTQPTIRVDFERVDRLINLVGELVINQAMLAQRVVEAGIEASPAVAMGLDELQHLTRDIQEGVMAIRAQPVRPLFQRMSRIAREVADATGKSVRLKTDGDATEIDKTVVERLADPLTHMIRNAIDHGIETPDKRIAVGKPAEGVVRLSAGHRSGRVVIEVADDGAGIDRSRVKSIAIKKGLVPPDIQLSDMEIDNLLFLPGFSTASSVSSISGRGVGMDVVKRSILALGGRISIASTPGLGSTFTMSLPLTLAVLDGMVVSIKGQTFVLPLTAIVETIQPAASSVHSMGSGSRVIAIRGSFLPLIDVGAELGIRDSFSTAESRVAILVETEGGERSALLVDSIQDQRQVVIKSLEANYGRTAGVAAATILGDGRVALILDVEALVAHRRTDLKSFELSNTVGS